MKVALMVVGGILVVFGLTDLIGSFAGFDLWTDIVGIQLPDIVWRYSAYAEMFIGYLIFKAGMGASEESTA
ncbi:MAG: hypothetical protein KUG78_16020, partial [Kangiellaceae bacterium]|nr:hypothetical protein [Kangiellaceae bacterium]